MNSSLTGYVKTGQDVSLSCQQSGNALNVSFAWVDSDGRVLPWQSMVTLWRITRNESGNYRCRTTHRMMEKYSRSISIDVICKFLSFSYQLLHN